MWQFSLTRVKPFPKEPNKRRFQKLSHWGQQCTLAQLAAAVHSLWCSPSWTTASSLLWSPRMFAWCSTRATPRSRPHAPCAASSAAATPSPPTRECSWCLCHCWCFLLEDLGSFSSFFFPWNSTYSQVLQPGFECPFLHLFQWNSDGFSLYWPLFQADRVGKRDPFFKLAHRWPWSWPGISCSMCSPSPVQSGEGTWGKCHFWGSCSLFWLFCTRIELRSSSN